MKWEFFEKFIVKMRIFQGVKFKICFDTYVVSALHVFINASNTALNVKFISRMIASRNTGCSSPSLSPASSLDRRLHLNVAVEDIAIYRRTHYDAWEHNELWWEVRWEWVWNLVYSLCCDLFVFSAWNDCICILLGSIQNFFAQKVSLAFAS